MNQHFTKKFPQTFRLNLNLRAFGNKELSVHELIIFIALVPPSTHYKQNFSRIQWQNVVAV